MLVRNPFPKANICLKLIQKKYLKAQSRLNVYIKESETHPRKSDTEIQIIYLCNKSSTWRLPGYLIYGSVALVMTENSSFNTSDLTQIWHTHALHQCQKEQCFSWRGMLKTWNVLSIIFSLRNQYKCLIHHKNCKTAGNSSASDFFFCLAQRLSHWCQRLWERLLQNCKSSLTLSCVLYYL